MRDTKSVGDISEAFVLAALLKSGKKVCIPFGEGHRYDLVVDEGEGFVRVQVKTGRIRDGAVRFNTSSWQYGGYVRDYVGGADLFGVYCPENGLVYLVPVGEACYLRLTEPQNNQKMHVKYASDYILPV